MLSPATATFSSLGGNRNATITTASGCGWAASTLAPWITLDAPSGIGSGPATLTYIVRPNASHTPRTGTIRVGSDTLSVTESGATSCQYLLPARTTFVVLDGAGTVPVEATEDCSWTVATPASWITLGSGPGTGNGMVTLILQPNPTHAPRTAMMTLGDQAMPTTQQGTAVPGDFDGDGRADPAIDRPSTGVWAVLRSSTSYTTSFSVAWRLIADITVPGDFDGDGKAAPAIYRPSTGLWAIVKSSTNDTSSFTVPWGLSTEEPTG